LSFKFEKITSSSHRHNLGDHGGHVGALERLLETGHLVEDAAEGPDVRALVVGLALADLGADVVGRAHDALGAVPSRQRVHHLADAKVAQLHHVFLCDEDVLCLQVSRFEE